MNLVEKRDFDGRTEGLVLELISKEQNLGGCGSINNRRGCQRGLMRDPLPKAHRLVAPSSILLGQNVTGSESDEGSCT
jgi:hypothetical protein